MPQVYKQLKSFTVPGFKWETPKRKTRKGGQEGKCLPGK
jgi:hypothetical protein